MPKSRLDTPRPARPTRVRVDGLPRGLRARARRLSRLRAALATRLDRRDAAHLTGVSVTAHRVVVFTDSPAWSTRLRYHAAEFEAVIEEHLGRGAPRIHFRVQPPTFRANRVTRRSLPAKAVQALESTARCVSDERLAAALRRLAGRGP